MPLFRLLYLAPQKKELRPPQPKAAQLLDSQLELIPAQPERTVALFHAVIETGQADTIPKIVDVLKLHTNDKSWLVP